MLMCFSTLTAISRFSAVRSIRRKEPLLVSVNWTETGEALGCRRASFRHTSDTPMPVNRTTAKSRESWKAEEAACGATI